MNKKFALLLSIILLCHISIKAQKATDKINYDIVILNGRVIDPETKLDAVRNVGIIDEKIAIVTSKAISGKKTIQAKGLVVAPGFIDLHAHGQSIAADRMQAFDGVTTSLELENGILPIAEWYQSQSKVKRVINYGASAAWTFSRIAEMENIEMKADIIWFQSAFALNKWTVNSASPEQVKNITSRIEQGLKEGALGIGVNAGYAPGGGYKELLAVHQLGAQYSVPLFTHIGGDYPEDPKSAAEFIGQIISYATITGSQEHICHLNSSSIKDIGTTRQMILDAQKRGLKISTEAYTYGASSTTIGASLFNEEAIEKKNIRYSQIELNGVPLNENTFHKTRKEAPGSVIVFQFLEMPKEEPLLDQSVLFPGGAIASDAMPWVDINTGGPVNDTLWPLSESAFSHPRSAGTFTRLLSHWVRERNAISLSEAIRKSSLIPAQILEKTVPQMLDKGRLQVGKDADIIIFDLDSVRDKASFTQPAQTSEGMKYVLVNGICIIDNEKLDLNAAPGKAIRRPVK